MAPARGVIRGHVDDEASHGQLVDQQTVAPLQESSYVFPSRVGLQPATSPRTDGKRRTRVDVTHLWDGSLAAGVGATTRDRFGVMAEWYASTSARVQ